MRRFALTLVAATLVACGGPSPLTPPPSDSCTSPPGSPVDTLALGLGNPADLTNGTSSPFAPLHDGDGVTPIRGGQGATMLGFVLQVSGASVPSCLDQHTLISDGSGFDVTQSLAPLTTYAQSDGTHSTHPEWLPASYPSTFVVAVSAGGQMVSLHLHLQ